MKAKKVMILTILDLKIVDFLFMVSTFKIKFQLHWKMNARKHLYKWSWINFNFQGT